MDRESKGGESDVKPYIADGFVGIFGCLDRESIWHHGTVSSALLIQFFVFQL